MKQRDPKNDLGIPDWRDADAYPIELTMPAWRWEFLRRRADYREAWAAQYDISQAYWDDLEKRGVLGEGERTRHLEMGARHLSQMAEDFGLNWIPAPAWKFEKTTPSVFESTYGFSYISAWREQGEKDEFGRHVIDARLSTDAQQLVAFDLSKPLAEQLKAAERTLEASQRELFGRVLRARLHKARWGTYLRVLDARDDGQTFEQIFEHIELAGLSQREFDERADRQNWAASGRQLWQQAHDLMFKLTPKT